MASTPSGPGLIEGQEEQKRQRASNILVWQFHVLLVHMWGAHTLDFVDSRNPHGFATPTNEDSDLTDHTLVNNTTSPTNSNMFHNAIRHCKAEYSPHAVHRFCVMDAHVKQTVMTEPKP